MSLVVHEVTLGRARVRFTGRDGGVSEGPYASANLALHVGDDAEVVRENRRLLADEVAGERPEHRVEVGAPDRWVWLDQRHGDTVAVLDRAPTEVPQADAAVTTQAMLPLVVLTADCAPIAIASDRAVGVVHAGWAGLERGVIKRAVEALQRADQLAGGDPSAPLRAILGPCIHAAQYEFGAADLDRLVARFGPSVSSTTAWGTAAFDLPAAVRIACTRAGVTDLDDLDVCTASSSDYFSYRRDGITGRQAVVVVREP